MIVVTVELHSAITGKVTTLGQAIIANDGTGSSTRGNYTAKIGRKGQTLEQTWSKPQRTGTVTNYPRLSLTIWHLVRRALDACYQENTCVHEGSTSHQDSESRTA